MCVGPKVRSIIYAWLAVMDRTVLAMWNVRADGDTVRRTHIHQRLTGDSIGDVVMAEQAGPKRIARPQTFYRMAPINPFLSLEEHLNNVHRPSLKFGRTFEQETLCYGPMRGLHIRKQLYCLEDGSS